MQPNENLPATKHPLVQSLDVRQGALAEMLPGGEAAAKRFKRVVIQAVVKNPDLMACSVESLISSCMEAAALGIEPTGTMGGAYLVPYKGKATLIVGYRGLIDLARRSGEIETIEARVVREGDEFSFQYGTRAGVDHIPDPASEKPLTHVYAVAKLRGGGVQFEVMTRSQVDGIRDRSKARDKGPWVTDYDEMARKTVVRRLVKYLPIAVEARDLIERDDAREFEYGSVVERVADDRMAAHRERIASRTAALRGESAGESETVDTDGGAVPEGTAPSGGSPGDPWMKRLHAVGKERGLLHEDIHEWAVHDFGVTSLTELSPSQRADLMVALEDMATDAADDPGAVAATGGTPESDESRTYPTTPTAFGVLIAGVLEQPNPVTDFRLLSADEWQRVWSAMELTDDDSFEAWWGQQRQPLRAALKAAGQSPRDRADRAAVVEAEAVS